MLLDTSAWVELFLGTEKGEVVEDILDVEPSFTSLVSVAEITLWCIRNQQDIPQSIQWVTTLSRVLPATLPIAVSAARVTAERKKEVKRWGMVDGIIYATARMHGLTVLTTDHHFAGLPQVKIL